MRRAMVMQGVLFQGVLAIVLLFMAWLSREEARFAAMWLWSLVIPVTVASVFWNAYKRTSRLSPDEAREGEKREGKRALAILGATMLVWVAGLMAILILL